VPPDAVVTSYRSLADIGRSFKVLTSEIEIGPEASGPRRSHQPSSNSAAVCCSSSTGPNTSACPRYATARRTTPSLGAGRLPAGVDRTPLESRLDALRPVELRAVRRTPLEGLFDHLITDSHYLGPLQGVGEQIKHLAFGAGRPLAAWASHHFQLWILSPYSMAQYPLPGGRKQGVRHAGWLMQRLRLFYRTHRGHVKTHIGHKQAEIALPCEFGDSILNCKPEPPSLSS